MDTNVTAKQNTSNGPDGEVLIGDPEFDGRIILYVIKGSLTGARLLCSSHGGASTAMLN